MQTHQHTAGRLRPVKVACHGNASQTQASTWEGFRRRLKHIARAHLDNRILTRADASDVVQEVYLQAIQKQHELAELTGSGQFRMLRRMVVGHAIDYFRRHVRSARRTVTRELRCERAPTNDSGSPRQEELAADTSGPYEKIIRQESLDQLRGALQRLSAGDQSLLNMRHQQQLSVIDIARRLNTSPTVVTTRHYRALRRLRRILEAVSQAGHS